MISVEIREGRGKHKGDDASPFSQGPVLVGLADRLAELEVVPILSVVVPKKILPVI